MDFLEWTKLWPTQFLVQVLEIKLTERLAKVFERDQEKPAHTKVGKSINNAFGKSPQRKKGQAAAAPQT